MATTLILLAGLLPATLSSPSELHTDRRTPWGDEFCRIKYCGVMTMGQQEQCCAAYKQCCAYVQMYKKTGPFAYLEPHEVAETPPPPPPPPPPPSSYSPSPIYVGPPKSMRLREEVSRSSHQPPQPPSLSLIRHQHSHSQPHPHRYNRPSPAPSHPRPAIYLLDEDEDLLKTSYSDQLVKDHERLCKHSYCGLLSPRQHKLCCNIYDACCAYSNYRKFFDPFHPDNGGRRR